MVMTTDEDGQYFVHMGSRPNVKKRKIAEDLYAAGYSLRAVADQMGGTVQAVHGLLKRSGVSLRGRGGSQGSHSRHKK